MQNSSKIYSPENRYAWVEIDLKNLLYNFKAVKKYISNFNNIVYSKPPKIMCVVKANAYGHGLVEISEQSLKAGADYLGVALVHEALKLRNSGITAPILCLGAHSPEKIDSAVKNNIILSVTSLESAELISSYCIRENKKAVVHIKIDTGMNRIGINYINAINDIISISKMPGIIIEGVFTHFACASKKDDSHTLMQWTRFEKIIDELKKVLPEIKLYHCANSAAFVRYPYMHLDMVRLGIIVYGITPFNLDYKDFGKETASLLVESLKPLLSLKAKISFIKKVPSGENISYCGTFTTKKDSIIATIPLGYADGYSWNFSNKSYVIYNGSIAPVAGNVTMDQTMVDLTGAEGAQNAKVGDEIILIGKSSNKAITATELAALIETINYEIVCMIGDRIPRIYINGGKYEGSAD